MTVIHQEGQVPHSSVQVWKEKTEQVRNNKETGLGESLKVGSNGEQRRIDMTPRFWVD